jgi:hypothetical protein
MADYNIPHVLGDPSPPAVSFAWAIHTPDGYASAAAPAIPLLQEALGPAIEQLASATAAQNAATAALSATTFRLRGTIAELTPVCFKLLDDFEEMAEEVATVRRHVRALFEIHLGGAEEAAPSPKRPRRA